MAARATTFDHAADIGVAGQGETLAEAFGAAARAMFGVMYDLDRVVPRREVAISCRASDHELLFVSWLNALLAEADLRGMVFSEFEVEIRNHSLVGRARGERFDPARHGRGVEVKGATLTSLRVERGPGGWTARTVVDV